MNYSVVNIDPPNYSRSVSLDSEIFFKVLGLSEENISSLSIMSSSEIIFKDGSFSPQYSGSYYTESEDGILFEIEKTTVYSKGESFVMKVFYPQELNYIYSIRFLSGKPYIYYSNVAEGEIVKSNKKIRLEFGDHFDTINLASLNIKINSYPIINGGVTDPKFSPSTSIESGDFLSLTVDHPEFFRSGDYKLEYYMSNSSSESLYGKINFKIDLSRFILPSLFPQAAFEGFNLGLDSMRNTGNGDEVSIVWHKFLSRINKSEVFSLIYVNEDRLSLFDSNPKYIAMPGATSGSISGLSAGKATSVAVRGMETFKGSFELSGMESNGGGLYIFPDEILSSETLLDNSFELFANSTDGYPASGLLLIDSSEVIKYTQKTSSSFIIDLKGRGLNGTATSTHPFGSSIRIFFECQDKNTNISSITPVFLKNGLLDRQDDMVEEVVTDFSSDDKRFFQGFDYCGYHQAIPNMIMEGKDDCGSYLGGEFNKQRGFNIFDRVQNRNEVLLEQVGEPIILLKRKWAGTTCDCIDLRKQHPRDKTCNRCFGTGFVGGFSQFSNLRREDERVLVRFKETKHDLNLSPSKHLNVIMEPQCWTLPIPSIRDRDVIVRFGFTGEVEYMYEVLDVTKERFIYKHYGRQNLSLKRLDKTDTMYTFNYLE